MKTGRRLTLAWCLAALVLAPPGLAATSAKAFGSSEISAPPQTDAPPVRRVGELVYDGIPEPSPAVRAAVRSARPAAAVRVQDWAEDGALLVLTPHGGREQAHRLPGPGRALDTLTVSSEPVRELRRTSGGGFVFLRDQGGDERFQIIEVGADGVERALTSPGVRSENLVVSPDGLWRAWSEVDPGGRDYRIVRQHRDDPGSRHIVLSEPRQIHPGAIMDGGEALIVVETVSTTARRLSHLDLASNTRRVIAGGDGLTLYRDIVLSPDGRELYMIGSPGSDRLRALRMDARTGDFAFLDDTTETVWDAERLDLSSDGRWLAWTVNEDGWSRLYLLHLQDGVRRRIDTLESGVAGTLRFSPDSARLAVTLESPRRPPTPMVLDLASGAVEPWVQRHTNSGQDAVTPELIRYASFDGRSIPSFLYRPPGASPAPVVIFIHGGPESQSRPIYDPTLQLWMAQTGAVILVPNIRGSTGYGAAYERLDNGLNRLDAVRDIGALLDWVETQSDLDSSRVIVAGPSYGGYLTLSVLADYGDRLIAAYAARGMTNLRTFLENTEAYRRDRRRVEYGDERDPELRMFMERIAPANRVQDLNRPMLLVVGRNDPRTPYEEFDRLTQAARRAGTPVWYLSADNEGHGFKKEENLRAQAETELQFLRSLLVPSD